MVDQSLQRDEVTKAENTKRLPNMIPVKKLLGIEVMNSDNEKLGKIEDIIIDQDLSTVAFGVLSFGGIAGIGDRLYSVPWHKLKYNKVERLFVLDIDKEKMKDIDHFYKGKELDNSNEKQLRKMYEEFGMPPRR